MEGFSGKGNTDDSAVISVFKLSHYFKRRILVYLVACFVLCLVGKALDILAKIGVLHDYSSVFFVIVFSLMVCILVGIIYCLLKSVLLFIFLLWYSLHPIHFKRAKLCYKKYKSLFWNKGTSCLADGITYVCVFLRIPLSRKLIVFAKEFELGQEEIKIEFE